MCVCACVCVHTHTQHTSSKKVFRWGKAVKAITTTVRSILQKRVLIFFETSKRLLFDLTSQTGYLKQS